jgi:hypothetical protein
MAEPIWKTATANINANTVLNAIENAPHFQEPASLEMQITVAKQGA